MYLGLDIGDHASHYARIPGGGHFTRRALPLPARAGQPLPFQWDVSEFGPDALSKGVKIGRGLDFGAGSF